MKILLALACALVLCTQCARAQNVIAGRMSRTCARWRAAACLQGCGVSEPGLQILKNHGYTGSGCA